MPKPLDYQMMSLLSSSVFKNKLNIETSDFANLFELMKQHAIASLPADLLSSLPIDDMLRTEWERYIYGQIFHNITLVRAEQDILSAFDDASVCALVMKGTSVARYYPSPKYRTMGDVDILVKPTEFVRASELMLQLGYCEITDEQQAKKGRHHSFKKGNITVELHRYFAEAGTGKQNEALDKYLLDDMSSGQHVPSELSNGLSVIEHVAQHIETGIGLRHIVDWMMYVNACLDDNTWNNCFHDAAAKIGMDKLAITVTAMCQKYLGLRKDGITWCASADEALCDDLMEYVLDSGNFGISRGSLFSSTLSKFPPLSKPFSAIKYLQKSGVSSWPAAKKHKILVPFAWIYQLNHYIKTAKENNISLSKIGQMRSERDTRIRLFENLGISVENR